MAEESTAARDVADQFTGIVRDLFNIEVNTILRDKITAQKMPGVRNALMDIGIEYFEILKEAEKNYRAKRGEDMEFDTDQILPSLGFFYTKDECENAKKEHEKKPPHEPDEINGEYMTVDRQVCEHLGGFEAFAIMRRWADKFLRDPSFLESLRSTDHLEKNLDIKKQILSVLPRIRENADMLKGMFSRICRRELDRLPEKKLTKKFEELKLEPSKLTPEIVVEASWEINKENLERARFLTNQYTRAEIISTSDPLEAKMDHSELVMVRKIWEVGTEVIAMQTTIQVDGDVITRLNPNYLDDEVYQKLSDYHKSGVDMALTYWGNLITIAKDLLGRLAGK